MQSNDTLYKNLGGLGYTGSIDDRLNKYMIAQGYIGSYTDKLSKFFTDQGYTGSFTDQYAQWRESGYIVYVPPTDDDFSKVVLLAHMNGTNGSTTFIDSSASAKTLTASDGVKITTADSMFNGSCGDFLNDTSTGRVNIAASSDFSFGTEDFTIEFFIRLKSNSAGYGRILAFSTSDWNSNDAWFIGTGSAWSQKVAVSSYKLGGDKLISTTALYPALAWTHIALTRESGVLKLWYNGVLEYTQSGYTSTPMEDSATQPLTIGNKYAGGTSENLPAYLAELRITKGLARYTANFDIPTTPFPDQ